MHELIEPGVARGRWWTRRDDGRIRCELCPRLCTMKPGQRGFCYVREARDEGMVLRTYGRASGFCMDPVEKKPLNHFYPGTSVLSFGTAGCNLGCRFCQNWDISKARADDRLVAHASPEEIAVAAAAAGARSIAFTYNDPTIFAEYAIDCAIEAHAHGLATIAVSAGYITAEPRAALYAHIDAANIDLKAFTERFYEKLCFAELAPVLETLEWIHTETDVWLEVTTLLIPGHNDGDDELRRLSDWFARHLGPDVPLHFSAFHPDYKLSNIPRTPDETLHHARAIARAAGLRHVYTGNVHDPSGQSTYCTSCGACVIERDWYQLGRWRLDAAGCCAECGTAIPGRFDARPGSWGPQRRHLAIAS